MYLPRDRFLLILSEKTGISLDRLYKVSRALRLGRCEIVFTAVGAGACLAVIALID